MEQIEQTKRHRRKSRPSVEPEASRLSKYILIVIAAVPIISTIAYGAVDIWAVGVLSLLASLLVILWAADSLKAGAFRFDTSVLQLPIAGLIVIACVQLLPLGGSGTPPGLLTVPSVHALSLDPYSTRFFLIRLVISLIFFAAALAYIDTRKRVAAMALMTVIFGATMAFAGILQRLASPDSIYGLRQPAQAIPFGPFVNQHHFAAFMEMTLGLTLGILLLGGAKKDKNALLGIAAAVMAIAAIMTGSRGGLLGMSGVVAVVIGARLVSGRRQYTEDKKRGSALAWIAGGAAVVIVVAGAVIFLGGGDSLLRGIGAADAQADISNGRIHFWGIALRIFLDNPILGAGLDAFGVAFTKYDTWSGIFRVEQAHNDYLQMLADGGVLAFACVSVFIFLFVRRALRIVNDSADKFRQGVAAGSLAGCFGILIHSFFDFPLRTQSNAFFFLLLVVLATVSVSDARRSAS